MPLWPLAVYFVVVLILLAGMFGIPQLLSERHWDRETGMPYESGIEPTGSARARFSIRFYLVAIVFVVFDLETMFLWAWAIALKPLGWSGYLEAFIFILILLVALAYLWREGALDWGTPAPPRKRSSPKITTIIDGNSFR
jgi:NADH-quinone oxidoreductase subunit A